MSNQLPDPRLTKVYRLEATLAEPLDLGDFARGSCSTCNREVSATAALRSWPVSGAAMTSTPASTPSARQPRSRPPPPISTG
jgi:hypothetical protein